MASARHEAEGHRFDGQAEKVEVDEQAHPPGLGPAPGAPAAPDNARQAVRAARVRATRARTRGPGT